MKIFLNENVFDKAIERLNFLFDEFDQIIVSFSGGKDSTLTMEMALKVAEERNRLPLKVMFLDQEAEYGMVIDYMRRVMADPRVEPLWLQVPIKLFNATSMDNPWLNCWHPDEEWMRPQEDISVKENIFGTDRFHDIFEKIALHYFGEEKGCYLGGVRAEESPTRLAGLTSGKTYKHITYGKKLNEKLGHYTFYPFYDWNLSDVWKSISNNKWDYCKIYDELYRYGLSPHKMRVSNLHHETAVHSLFFLHEVENHTWNALVKRLGGINQAKHMEKTEMFAVQKLPYMFNSWKEYRDYLTIKLITIPKNQEIFIKRWKKMDIDYAEMNQQEDLIRKQIASLLANDWEFVKLDGFMNSPHMIVFREYQKGRANVRNRPPEMLKYVKEANR